jgi:hypothetical protein
MYIYDDDDDDIFVIMKYNGHQYSEYKPLTNISP